MSDHFQTIVDAECLSEVEAAELGRRVLHELIERGIVEPEPCERDYVPEASRAPGPRLVEALSHPLGPDDERRTRTLWMNVVAIVAHRSVFHAGEGGCELICPHCDARHEAAHEWGNAVGEWFDESGPGRLPCPECEIAVPVTEWGYDPPYGFSCLGITFWNWPPLSPRFVDAIAELLGHRVILVRGMV